jgi:hypothetical protein
MVVRLHRAPFAGTSKKTDVKTVVSEIVMSRIEYFRMIFASIKPQIKKAKTVKIRNDWGPSSMRGYSMNGRIGLKPLKILRRLITSKSPEKYVYQSSQK